MNWKYIGYGFGALFILVLIGAVGWKVVAPSNNTVIGQGGKQVIVSPDVNTVPLAGCSFHRIALKAYWQNNLSLKDKK